MKITRTGWRSGISFLGTAYTHRVTINRPGLLAPGEEGYLHSGGNISQDFPQGGGGGQAVRGQDINGLAGIILSNIMESKGYHIIYVRGMIFWASDEVLYNVILSLVLI